MPKKSGNGNGHGAKRTELQVLGDIHTGLVEMRRMIETHIQHIPPMRDELVAIRGELTEIRGHFAQITDLDARVRALESEMTKVKRRVARR